MDIVSTLSKLNAAFGPSGCESGISSVIAQLARPYVDEVTTDTMGNLICRKKGSGAKLMFAAHMDSIGFIVTHIEKEGFLRVGALGGVNPKKVIHTPVRFANGTAGVFVPEEKADLAKLKLNECYIDIGARDEAEAKSLVQIGDAAVYDTAVRTAGSRIISPYLDDRIACVILLCAMETLQNSENDLSFVFTVQEEVGCRGSKTAAWALDPDYGIAVDVTGVDDVPGCDRNGTAKLGRGAAVKVMDRSVICHPAVVARLEELAEAEGIAVQRDILRVGGTDAGPIHTTRAGVYTGGISIPCRYTHSPAELADLGDVEACIQLVRAFAEAKLEKEC